MNTTQFIAEIEAKDNFLKWAQDPKVVETTKDIEKWYGLAYIKTPDGTNTFNVWFMNDVASDTATWQTLDTLSPDENSDAQKMKAFENYLTANFLAYFMVKADIENVWAEATVFKDGVDTLTRVSVLVYMSKGALTHKEIA